MVKFGSLVERNKDVGEAAEKVSPEEKLLKVIQGGEGQEKKKTPEEKLLDATKGEEGRAAGGKGQGAPAKAQPAAAAKPAPATAGKPAPAAKAEPKAASAAAPEAKSAAKADEKSKLKLADAPKPSDAAEAKAASIGMIGASAPAPAAESRKPGVSFNIRTVNVFLGVAGLVIFGLAIFDAWGAVSATRLRSEATPGQEGGEGKDGGLKFSELKAMDDYRKIFEKPIFPMKEPDKVPGGPSNTVPQEVWAQTLKEWQGIGFMGQPGPQAEIIVMDQKEKRMHFLKMGQTVSIAGQEIKVKEVQTDRVIFTDGKAEAIMKFK